MTYSEDKHTVREGPVGRHQALAASWWPSTQASWLRERGKEQGQREKLRRVRALKALEMRSNRTVGEAWLWPDDDGARCIGSEATKAVN